MKARSKRRQVTEAEMENWVTIPMTPQVRAALAKLSTTGYFGASVAEVAEQLLVERLRQLVVEGWWLS